jgi:uncharacterized membrane protein
MHLFRKLEIKTSYLNIAEREHRHEMEKLKRKQQKRDEEEEIGERLKSHIFA